MAAIAVTTLSHLVYSPDLKKTLPLIPQQVLGRGSCEIEGLVSLTGRGGNATRSAPSAAGHSGLVIVRYPPTAASNLAKESSSMSTSAERTSVDGEALGLWSSALGSQTGAFAPLP